jgi:hypothetical protein
MNIEGIKTDKWIDALPENPYDLCPCGCNKKLKFIKDNLEEHENNFKKQLNILDIP